MQPKFHLPKIYFNSQGDQWAIGQEILYDWDSVMRRLELLEKEGAQLNRNSDGVEVDLSDAFGPQSLNLVLNERILFVRRCTSTQATAKASEGEFTIVIANEQTDGRGRLGRQWLSEPGRNILMSMVMKPDGPVEDWARGPLLWAAVIAECLGLYVKWPNDIVTSGGQKIGGILSSLEHDQNGKAYLIFGLGLNVNQTIFPKLPHASSLSMVYESAPSRLAIIRTLVDAIREVHLTDSLDLWRSRCQMLGSVVRVAGIEGVAEAIREDGALIVGGQTILSGDVEIVEGLKQ